jgi:mannose-6-phosphate isomerase
MELYPLKFFPIYKNKIWGGNRLKTFLNRDIEEENVGESWEISTNNDSISIVKNGGYKNQKLTELIEEFPEELLGDRYNSDDQFPLLLKIIDATKKLSVQVHPNDKLAKELENGNGKSEMWYVLSATKNAKLYIGLNDIKGKNHLREVIEQGKLQNYLNAINVQRGDFFYIPAGTVHAIGSGLMLVEIQQNSNTTYRLYDWNRMDENGESRDLHLGNGIKATDLNSNIERYESIYKKETPEYKRKVLTISNHFVSEKVTVKNSFKLDHDDFALITCIENNGLIKYSKNKVETLKEGESAMIPANLEDVKVEGNLEFLYMYIPDDINYYIQKLKSKGFTSFNL